MTRFLKIEELTFPVKALVPEKDWTEEEHQAGTSTRTTAFRLNTGDLMVEMLVKPNEKRMGQEGSVTAAKTVDFAWMRQVQKPLDYLDSDGDGECDLPLGSWAELN